MKVLKSFISFNKSRKPKTTTKKGRKRPLFCVFLIFLCLVLRKNICPTPHVRSSSAGVREGGATNNNGRLTCRWPDNAGCDPPPPLPSDRLWQARQNLGSDRACHTPLLLSSGAQPRAPQDILAGPGHWVTKLSMGKYPFRRARPRPRRKSANKEEGRLWARRKKKQFGQQIVLSLCCRIVLDGRLDVLKTHCAMRSLWRLPDPRGFHTHMEPKSFPCRPDQGGTRSTGFGLMSKKSLGASASLTATIVWVDACVSNLQASIICSTTRIPAPV